jgi:hypothetical protein
VVIGRFFRDAPSQVDHLEVKADGSAAFSQARVDFFHEHVPLLVVIWQKKKKEMIKLESNICS